MKILVTPTSMQPPSKSAAMERLQGFADQVVFNTSGKPLNEDELIPLLKDCDGYIAGLDTVTERVLEACPRLKAISRYGVGYDRVDIKAAKKRGIIVTNTPGTNSQAVAELVMGLILCLARKIHMLDQETRKGKWVRSVGTELCGKTIGIIGLGSIGKKVAKCCSGFGMRIIAFDPFIDKEYCKATGIDIRDFDDLIEESDVISLHVPLTDDTRNLINRQTIMKMKRNAILINTSRGGIIDELALYEALKANRLGGLGLDAYEVEPPADSPLLELENVVATPHTGSHTHEAIERMQNLAVENLIDVLSGKGCPYIVS